MFPQKALDFLYCPQDGGTLVLSGKMTESQVVNGEVVCKHDSSHRYKITNGILKLMPVLDNLDQKIQSEIKARDKQAERYDLKLASRFDKELPSTLSAIGSVLDKNVIEYGCGTGRVTEHLLEAKLLIAIDFSYESLTILANKLNNNFNLALVQSEIISTKVKPKSFDVAVSIQVIEHIPTPQMRSNFLASVGRGLLDRGIFVLSAYHYDLRRRIKKQPQAGVHNSGITYYYFNKQELKQELKQFFIPQVIKIIDITWPLEVRLGLNKILGGFLSKWGENISVVNSFGHLILVKAKKRVDFVHYKWGLWDSLFLVKHWFWFTNPKDIPGSAMVNFFTYQDIKLSGFHKKEGLTTIIDLNKPLPEIYNNFRVNFIQKQIRRGERNEIIVKHDLDFKNFKSLYFKFRKSHKLPKERLKPIKEVGEFFSAYYRGKVIAGGLFITNGIVMRAWALASQVGDQTLSREIIGQANRLVLWQAIKYAKAIGCIEFDLGGISPESPNRHLRTLSEFKEAFGGSRRKNFYYYKIYSPLIRFWMRFRGFKDI